MTLHQPGACSERQHAMSARDLMARKTLLLANATLQRVRLAHDIDSVRQAWRPPPGAGLVVGGAALVLALWARPARAHGAPTASTAASASAWALRGLTLWRAANTLLRTWRDTHPRQN